MSLPTKLKNSIAGILGGTRNPSSHPGGQAYDDGNVSPIHPAPPKDITQLYDRDYAEQYNERFLLNEFSKIDTDFEQQTISKLLSEIGDDSSWLDVSCGTGYFLSRFPEVQRAGFDISPAMLEAARKANPDIPLIEGDYRDEHPELENKWDLVSCMWWAYGYVNSLAEVETVFENLARWTSNRGTCFVPICEPDFIGTGKTSLAYDYKKANRMSVDWGQIYVEAVIWTWIDEYGGKNNKSMVAPKPEYAVFLFEKYFEQVEIIEYPRGGKMKSTAIVARHKK